MKNALRRLLLSAIILTFTIGHCFAQPDVKGLEPLFTLPESYIVHFTEKAPVIDGKIDDPSWQNASWSNDFVDIEGAQKPTPSYRTRMKMLWDDTCLYIAASLDEPNVWATLRNHDDIVFHDNDFEIFIDPANTTHQYYEVEVNAMNTVFDLFMTKPYRNGGSALIDWDLRGLRSAVYIKGTLNNPQSVDSGWTVEAAIPFRSLSAGGNRRIPRQEQLWRINFSRVEWDTEIKDGMYSRVKDATGKPKPEHNWVWSPQGVINMHYPERWGYLQFSRNSLKDTSDRFVLPAAEKQKYYLWLCYYRQKAFFSKNGRYASTFKELGINDTKINIDAQSNQLSMEATTRQFMIYITQDNRLAWSVNNDGLVQVVRAP